MAAAGADGGGKGPRWYGGPFAWLARLHHEMQRRLQAAGRAGVAVAVEGAVDVSAFERVFERGFEGEMAADAPVGHQVGHAVGREGVAVDVRPPPLSLAAVAGGRGAPYFAWSSAAVRPFQAQQNHWRMKASNGWK